MLKQYFNIFSLFHVYTYVLLYFAFVTFLFTNTIFFCFQVFDKN